jgi:predicted transcriptional regulator
MKTGDKRSTCKSSCRSRGGVSTRRFERIATRYPMQAVIFTFREFEFPLKNFSLVRSVSTKLSEIFEKTLKNEEARGHRAVGSPRAGSVFALVQRR